MPWALRVWIAFSSALAEALAWAAVRVVRVEVWAWATRRSALTFVAGISSTVQVARAAARRQGVSFTAIDKSVAISLPEFSRSGATAAAASAIALCLDATRC